MAAFISWKPKDLPIPIDLVMGFDVVLSETHELNGETTKHGVEKGSNITDHVIIDPEVLTLEVQISNAPLTQNDLFGFPAGRDATPKFLDVPSYEPPFAPTPGAVFGAVGRAVRSQLGQKREYVAQVLQFYKDQNFIKIAHTQLWDHINNRQLLKVYTKTRIYENMLLVRAPMSRSPGLGDSATFNLEFNALRIVESKSVTIPKEIVAKKPVDKGQKSPKELPQSSVVRSDAFGIAEKLGLPKQGP